MKYSKKQTDDIIGELFLLIVAKYGLKTACKVINGINKLLREEKKRRRKNE